MLLRNARLSGRAGSPVDVLVRDGLVADIGESVDAASEEIVDLGGLWLSPGLWDQHVHFSQVALRAQRLDLSGARSAREAAALVAAALRADSPDPFVGIGFRDGLWPDAPGLADLDAASDRPVVLVSGDLHAVWMNTPALARYGHAGHPTGLVWEDDAFEVVRAINTVPDALLDRWAIDAAQAATARGVVGIVDLEMAWNADAWVRRTGTGFDALRVEFGVYSEHLDRAVAEGFRTGLALTELATVGPYKVLTDGSLNTRTAYCYDEYAGLEGQPGSRGMLTVPFDRLVSLVSRAARAGLTPAVHAIGDHANTLALDAFAAVGCRGRIEHAQLLSRADLPRFASLGVDASVQPDHAMDDRDVAERHWHGRTDRAFPLRSLLDAGARLRFGSDAPVSALDPWATMAAAVGRQRDGREPWHPEQSITAEEALAASVRSAIRVGRVADLVATDRDPTASSADELRGMGVAATVLGGRFTFSAL